MNSYKRSEKNEQIKNNKNRHNILQKIKTEKQNNLNKIVNLNQFILLLYIFYIATFFYAFCYV